jgi:AraC-like DNA-binding protein
LLSSLALIGRATANGAPARLSAILVRMSVAEHLRLLRRARDRIDRDFAQPLDVATIACEVGMSAGHFSRRFRDAYGEPPYSYLMTRRIERAMSLLRRGELSVTEVCFAVGFSSLGTFSTRFTEVVGVPPTVYRGQRHEPIEAVAPCIAKRVSKPVRNREALTRQHA